MDKIGLSYEDAGAGLIGGRLVDTPQSFVEKSIEINGRKIEGDNCIRRREIWKN